MRSIKILSYYSSMEYKLSIQNKILPDNPAARLQSFLGRMLEAEYEKDEQFSVVFARILDIKNNPSEIFPYYSQLFMLIEDAYNTVLQYYPKQERTHSQWRVYLVNTFQKHSPYHHQWEALISKIGQGTHLDIIQVANDNLEHFVRSTTIDGLAIDELEAKLSNLIIDIENSSELTDYLKVFLKEELEKILDYIKHFDLYGSDPIRKSIYNIIGNTEVSKNLTSKAIMGVNVLLIAVASSIGIVNDIASFPDSVSKLKKEFYLPDYKTPTVLSAKDDSDIMVSSKLKVEKQLNN